MPSLCHRVLFYIVLVVCARTRAFARALIFIRSTHLLGFLVCVCCCFSFFFSFVRSFACPLSLSILCSAIFQCFLNVYSQKTSDESGCWYFAEARNSSSQLYFVNWTGPDWARQRERADAFQNEKLLWIHLCVWLLFGMWAGLARLHLSLSLCVCKFGFCGTLILPFSRALFIIGSLLWAYLK